MLATDPLSLLFLGCALFSGLFLVAAVMLGAGGHGHLGHIGHAGHIGHVGHLGAGDDAASSHAGGHASSHAGGHASSHAVGHANGHSAAHVAHATPAQAEGQTSVAAQTEGVWGMAQSLLLGSLNLNGALIFLLVFGVLGYLLNIGQATPLLVILLLAALVGAVAAIGVNAALTRIFITSQAGELSTDNSRLEGRLATVSIAIRERGLGEVVYSGEAGARHSVGARSSDGASIPTGAQVVIVAADGGLVTVQQWERFLDETRQRLSANPQAPHLEPGPTLAAPPGVEAAEPTPRE